MEDSIFELPHGDYDQHYSTHRQIRTLSRYECYEDSKVIFIDDPAWGKERIGDRPGDEIFTELYTNPLVQRVSGIELLTLPEHFATMPGSTNLSRWEHAWGSVVFVRRMIQNAEVSGRHFDDREILSWQLRTFVSDLGHTAFSHLGDWLFQGYGGNEDHHDKELHEILEVGGVNDILRSHGFDPAEIIFPKVQDWVECDAPDLCVDRVDYGVREILRWVGGYEPPQEWERRFMLDEDNKIVMSTPEDARYFGVAFALLATEHWSHPVHRLQEQLFGELVKATIVDEDFPISEFHNLHHPRDLMYAIDRDILASTRAVGSVNYDLHALMLDIARAQRKIFAQGRETELERFLSPYRPENSYAYKQASTDGFPHPLKAHSWMTRYTGVKPNNIAFIPVKNADEVLDFDKLLYTLDVFLPPLKRRQVDPHFVDGNANQRRLSESDARFARLLSQQDAMQRQSYVARIYADPFFIQKLKENLKVIEQAWQRAITYERAPKESRQRHFRDMGGYAIALSGNIHLFGG